MTRCGGGQGKEHLEDRNPSHSRPTTLPRYSNHVANRNKHFVCLTQLLSVYFKWNCFHVSVSVFSHPKKDKLQLNIHSEWTILWLLLYKHVELVRGKRPVFSLLKAQGTMVLWTELVTLCATPQQPTLLGPSICICTIGIMAPI